MILLNKKKKLQVALLTGVSAFAFLVGGISVGGHALLDLGTHSAIAEGSGSGGGGGGGNGGGGGGNGGGGHDAESGDHEGGMGKQGAGGHGGEEGSGQGQGKQGASDSGGKDKPNWAGAELADIGRMNVIKSPDKILQKAIDNMDYNPATQAALYSMSAEDFAAALVAANNLDSLIDSPVVNSALLKEYWEDGTTSLTGVTPKSYTDFSGILIGTADDKTVPVTTEMVEALLTITGETLPAGVTAADIAAAAEDVRQAISDVHG